jgi:hypothetical protein
MLADCGAKNHDSSGKTVVRGTGIEQLSEQTLLQSVCLHQ